MKILEGKGSEEQNHVIAATVCEAIHCMKTNLNRQELFQEALAHIYSGKSLQLVNKIRS